MDFRDLICLFPTRGKDIFLSHSQSESQRNVLTFQVSAENPEVKFMEFVLVFQRASALCLNSTTCRTHGLQRCLSLHSAALDRIYCTSLKHIS